jgi:hypothetical protein
VQELRRILEEGFDTICMKDLVRETTFQEKFAESLRHEECLTAKREERAGW